MILKAKSPVAEGDITKNVKSLQLTAERGSELLFLRDLVVVMTQATDRFNVRIFNMRGAAKEGVSL